MTEISKIPFVDLKIYPSFWKFCEILLEQQNFIPDLLAWGDILLSQ